MLATALLAVALAAPAPRADDTNPAEGVKKVSLTIDPVEAKPGQTVTLKLTVTLAEGCRVYPFEQKDKGASFFVSRAKFPKPDAAGLVYVGAPAATTEPQTVAEEELKVEALEFFTGSVTFEKKAVVAPDAKPGDVTAKFASLKLNVCKGKDCYRATELKPEATLKVLAGPAVSIDKDYAAEVKKALESK